MKILNLVFHPNLQQSRVNRTWKKQLEDSGKITTSRHMYSEYSDFAIDVEKEQALLFEHDRIVFQFPLYWYSTPPLVKKWQDDVLTFNFAYGTEGDKLNGKDLQLIISVGGRAKFYSGFDIFASIPDLMRPFQLTANLAQMNYLEPKYMYEADETPVEAVEAFGRQLIQKNDDPRRSDPRQYLYDEMSADADVYYQESA